MKNTSYHTCKPVRHTQCYIKGVIIFITETLRDPHKIRISLHCPNLKKKNKSQSRSLYNKYNRYLCMQKEDCVLCEGMTLPPLERKILHLLLELSQHTHTPPVRGMGIGRRQEYAFLGSSYPRSRAACAFRCTLRKSTFAITVLEEAPEITLTLFGVL